MSLYKINAIVLSSINVGEADKIVTFFSFEKGKIKGAAKGVRRLRNKFGSSLEPFTCCGLVLFEKKSGSLYRINQSDILHSFQSLREDGQRIMTSAYLANLIQLFTVEEDANKDIFSLLYKTLLFIEERNDHFDLISRIFEIKLLNYSGYFQQVDKCIRCGKVFDKKNIYLSEIAGGIVCEGCIDLDREDADIISKATTALVSYASKMDLFIVNRIKPTHIMLAQMKKITGLYINQIKRGKIG